MRKATTLRSAAFRKQEQDVVPAESRLRLISHPVATIQKSPARNLLRLRIACWAVVLGLGAIQSWVVRFVMHADGVSYLDVADALWRGDWHHAINAYWSPLYPAMIGFFHIIIKPGTYWEYPVVHLVNFFIYAGALACFDFFLMTFIADRKRRDFELPEEKRSGLAESSWCLLGYGLFVSSSLILIGLYRVTPDLAVAAFVYLASGLIIKVRTGTTNRAIYALLGAVLGLAYLTKAAMFPLAFVFLAAAFFSQSRSKRHLQNLAIATLIFFAVSAPLSIAISRQVGRLTFGESGSWNYSIYVNQSGYWPTDSPALKHPLRRISSLPPIYEFAEPVGGTFPPWYDPTYWHDGIKPRFSIRGEIKPLTRAAQVYGSIFFLFFLSAVLGACVLFFLSGGLRAASRRAAQNWAIAVPALATLLLYAPVHVEGRFIAACVTILLLVAYAGVGQISARHRSKLIQPTVAVVALALVFTVVLAPKIHWPVSGTVYAYPRPMPGPNSAQAATALEQRGIHSNDKIGLIWNEKWASGAAQGAIVAHLLRVKIVSEITDADGFWKLDSSTRLRAIETLKGTGIRAILAREVPSSNQEGWVRLGGTEYFAYLIP